MLLRDCFLGLVRVLCSSDPGALGLPDSSYGYMEPVPEGPSPRP